MLNSLARDIEVLPRRLPGFLAVPTGAPGIVVFAHGSGSSRLSARNQIVASGMNKAGLATLLFDLLLPDEAENRRNVFNIQLLATRLEEALDWLGEGEFNNLPIGLFGASTGAAAALIAAARHADDVLAVVSRGGRPDLAVAALTRVKAPTMLIVGGNDVEVIKLNERHWPSSIVKSTSKSCLEQRTCLRSEARSMDWFIGFPGKGLTP